MAPNTVVKGGGLRVRLAGSPSAIVQFCVTSCVKTDLLISDEYLLFSVEQLMFNFEEMVLKVYDYYFLFL